MVMRREDAPARREISAVMWERGGEWFGRLRADEEDPVATVSAPSRAACVMRLRLAAGKDATLTIEERPVLVGVAEAARLLGWDKRRVATYISRGSFPEPVAELASGRIWLRSEIEAYGRARGYPRPPRRAARG